MAMDVVVGAAQGLPEKAYVSIRAGDVRKQALFKPGERYHFDVKTPPKHLTVEIFEKVGSTQVSLADFPPGEAEHDVGLVNTRGEFMKIAMMVKAEETEDDKQSRRLARHQAALEAKHYLDEHAVQQLLRSMVHELLAAQPKDALTFMSSYLRDYAGQNCCADAPTPTSPPAASPLQETTRASSPATPCPDDDEESDDSLPDWSSRPGLGEEEMPGFAVDGTSPLPNLEDHHSIVAKVLRNDPSIYARLKDERTRSGALLAKCIKTGIDNRGHPLIKTIGMVAADEECYDVFQDVFQPVVSAWHGAYPADAVHPCDIDLLKVATSPIDPVGKYAISVEVCGSRNLSGLQMPPAISREGRREVERLLTGALLGLEGKFGGSYQPLRGSGSFEEMPRGMSEDMESELEADHLLFEEPDTHLALCSGFGRHWPEARGVFVAHAKDMAAWVNEVDHLKVIVRRRDHDLQKAFSHFAEATGAIRVALQAGGRDFSSHAHFGFLSSCPSNLGTGLSVVVTLCTPLLCGKQHRFKALAKDLGLSVCLRRNSTEEQEGGAPRGPFFDVRVGNRLGRSEVDQVNVLIDGCRKLIEMEQRLEAGEVIDVPEVAGAAQADAVAKTASDAQRLEAADVEQIATALEACRASPAVEAAPERGEEGAPEPGVPPPVSTEQPAGEPVDGSGTAGHGDAGGPGRCKAGADGGGKREVQVANTVAVDQEARTICLRARATLEQGCHDGSLKAVLESMATDQ